MNEPMPETTLTIVARRQPIGAVDDKRNRAWLHDGERWTRPDRISVRRRYVPSRKPLRISAERRLLGAVVVRRWASSSPADVSASGPGVAVYTCHGRRLP